MSGRLNDKHQEFTSAICVMSLGLCPLQASYPEVQDQVLAELQEAKLAAKDGKGRPQLLYVI
jgi:hypothetical protein